MAQNVTVAGASYEDVPAVSLPKSGGGTATFYDTDSLSDVFAAKDHNHAASDINSGTLDSARLPTSGVTAGSYGPSSNASPAHGGSFSVPYVTFDNKGRATAASTKTITLPSSSSGLTATDLWTNASPGSSFSAQTISLSAATNGFKLILIVYRFDSSGGMWSTLIPYAALYSYGCTLNVNASSYNRVGARAVSQSSYSQMTFASASYNAATANGYVIPYKVIGLK